MTEAGTEMVRKKGQLKVSEMRATKLREQLGAAEKIVVATQQQLVLLTQKVSIQYIYKCFFKLNG